METTTHLVLALMGLLALSAVAVHLVRPVARDGLGGCATPRSHAAELGTWVDRELGR